ncbi:MAG TPA: TIGR00295 family protein [Nitrospirota bacterium]|nr:TIGR00295 family protein [Nitrospirota bacterium]
MNDPDVDVLIAVGCSPAVVAHCKAVSKMALSIARCVTIASDHDLVRKGGLFHDIGRSKTHGIDHAVEGVAIARNHGFPDKLVNIIERHIGAGITAREAVRLGLPEKDYLPQTVEEKIVSYADNLVSGTKEMQFYEALDRFKKILGPGHEGVELFLKQHNEMRAWMR